MRESFVIAFPRPLWLNKPMLVSDKAALLAQIPRLAGHTVGVVGDPVLDVYVYGSTHRISREAPVLIVKEEGREARLGGAANTAANVAALGGRPILLGLVGDDPEGKELASLAQGAGIDATFLVARQRGHTVTKTRIMAGGLHTRKQQMLRVDRENDGPLSSNDADLLFASVRQALPQLDAVIISDYGEPALTDPWVRLAQEARAAGKIVIVDSRHALRRFVGVTAVTPNEPEVEEAFGIRLGTESEALAAGRRLAEELQLQVALVTRGREGMAVCTPDGALALPAHGGHEAVDVTGAGDTVTATFALALAAQVPPADAATLANCAASVVVKVIGTATCSPAELAAAVDERGSLQVQT